MADAGQVAEGFFDAWTGKDFQRARGLLFDDVSFEGPIDSFSAPASGTRCAMARSRQCRSYSTRDRSRRCSEPSPAAEDSWTLRGR